MQHRRFGRRIDGDWGNVTLNGRRGGGDDELHGQTGGDMVGEKYRFKMRLAPIDVRDTNDDGYNDYRDLEKDDDLFSRRTSRRTARATGRSRCASS